MQTLERKRSFNILCGSKLVEGEAVANHVCARPGFNILCGSKLVEGGSNGYIWMSTDGFQYPLRIEAG